LCLHARLRTARLTCCRRNVSHVLFLRVGGPDVARRPLLLPCCSPVQEQGARTRPARRRGGKDFDINPLFWRKRLFLSLKLERSFSRPAVSAARTNLRQFYGRPVRQNCAWRERGIVPAVDVQQFLLVHPEHGCAGARDTHTAICFELRVMRGTSLHGKGRRAHTCNRAARVGRAHTASRAELEGRGRKGGTAAAAPGKSIGGPPGGPRRRLFPPPAPPPRSIIASTLCLITVHEPFRV